MKNADVIELAPFEISESKTESELVAASDRLDQFLRTLDGYRGRLLLKKADKEWMDIVFWESATAAEAMMEKMQGSSICADYFACMKEADHDDPAAGVTLYQRVKAY